MLNMYFFENINKSVQRVVDLQICLCRMPEMNKSYFGYPCETNSFIFISH